MTPTEKLLKAREIWKDVEKHKAKGESLVLELLRHPDTTPEQLQDCRRVMRLIEGHLEQAVTGLRRAFPPLRNGYTQYPWHDLNYNRYDEAMKPKEKANESN